MKASKFYKDRYLIAEYDDGDNLVQIFDNVYQLAEYYCKTYQQAKSFLLEHLSHNTRFFLIDLLSVENDDFYDADVDTIRTMFPCP